LSNILKIKALKFPNVLHYEWEGEIIEKTPNYILVLCKSGRKLIHHSKNDVYTINNTSIEYFSLKEWYTAAMEVEEGVVVSTYCNVAMPSVLNNNELSFIDLDLDLVKRKNKDWEVVDEDEFEVNSIKYQYPEELKNEALKALENLKQEVARCSFPFNKEITSLIK
jgi:protein associated with RNAse G/E